VEEWRVAGKLNEEDVLVQDLYYAKNPVAV